MRERDRLVDGTPGHGPIRGGTGTIGTGPRTRGRSARGHTTNPNPHWTYRTIGRVLLGYTVYGPYEWMMRRVHGYAQGHWHNRGYYPGELSDTFFHEYMPESCMGWQYKALLNILGIAFDGYFASLPQFDDRF